MLLFFHEINNIEPHVELDISSDRLFFVRASGFKQVYYGFSPRFIAWGKMHIIHFEFWMEQMKGLLDQEGVLYKGATRVVAE